MERTFQGQGSQEDHATEHRVSEIEIIHTQEGRNNDLDTTQMNALLNIRDNQLSIFLQGCYYSKYCSIFYVCLLVLALLLILVTIIEGIQVTRTVLFLVCEFVVNSMITIDFAFRLKLAGVRKFFLNNVGRPKWWSFFDVFVVVTCNIMFVVSVSLRSSAEEDWFEAFEETFFVLWAI